MTEIKRSFDLPFGYRAEFEWRDGCVEVGWTPDLPHIKREKAQRKFQEAYEAARRSFFTEVAAVMGGPVLVADIGNAEGAEVIRPPAKH
jgi:hypothetical protein